MQNMLMPSPPEAQTSPMGPQSAPPPLASPEQIADTRNHINVVSSGLADLAARPKGSLSKQDVFNALAEMIAQGAFSTSEAKQNLVAQVAQVPDDEAAIRQLIGHRRLMLSEFQDHFSRHFPEGAPDA